MIIKTDKEALYAIGDIHGEFAAIANWIKRCDLQNCAVIFCGDFGLGFESLAQEKKFLTKANRLCEKRNIELYALRGNHDDPSYYQGEDRFGLSHFKALSDYDLIVSPSHTILCLGGAVSVDRVERKNWYEMRCLEVQMKSRMHLTMDEARKKVRKVYWPDEKFIYDESKLEQYKDYKIDVICSHSCPSIAWPLTKNGIHFWCRADENLEADLDEERGNFMKVFDYLKEHGHPLNKWIYGHYHSKMNEVILGTNFILLDMGRETKKRDTHNAGANFDMTEF